MRYNYLFLLLCQISKKRFRMEYKNPSKYYCTIQKGVVTSSTIQPYFFLLVKILRYCDSRQGGTQLAMAQMLNDFCFPTDTVFN